MPKELHDKLARKASSKGLTGERRDAYIYGGMRKTGWKPERERGKRNSRKRDRSPRY